MKNKKVKIKFKPNDYDESLLPSTRKSQFKDILTHEYKSLLLLGVALFIFFIPIILLESFSSIFIYTYIEQNNGNLTPEEMKSFEMMMTLIKEGLMVILIMIFSIGISGCLRIIRNLVYGEVLFFKNDFLLGIKKYWKLCLASSFVFAFLRSSTNILSYFVNNYSNANYLYIFSGFAIGFFYLFIVPLIYFYVFLSITYECGFWKCLNLSIRFSLSNFLVGLAFSLILFALNFLWYIGILLVVILILIALVIFIAPIYMLLWHLYVTSRFDKYINKNQFKDFYRKGLRKEE